MIAASNLLGHLFKTHVKRMSISKVLSLLENLTKEKNYPSYGNKHMLSDFNVS